MKKVFSLTLLVLLLLALMPVLALACCWCNAITLRDQGLALKLLAAGSLPEDQRLCDVVSDQTWDLIESRLADLAMDVEE